MPEHSVHLLLGPEVLEGYGPDVLVPVVNRPHHVDKALVAAVGEVESFPQARVIAYVFDTN